MDYPFSQRSGAVADLHLSHLHPARTVVRVKLLKRILLLIVMSLCVLGAHYLMSRPQKGGSGDKQTEVTLYRLDTLAQACEEYRKLVGTWPLNGAFLMAAIPIANTNVLLDAWGREFVFISYTNAPGMMWLKSYGADGIPDGIGVDADIIYRVP